MDVRVSRDWKSNDGDDGDDDEEVERGPPDPAASSELGPGNLPSPIDRREGSRATAGGTRRARLAEQRFVDLVNRRRRMAKRSRRTSFSGAHTSVLPDIAGGLVSS